MGKEELPSGTGEDAGMDFVHQEFSQDGLGNVVAQGEFLHERQGGVHLERSAGPVFVEEPLQLFGNGLPDGRADGRRKQRFVCRAVGGFPEGTFPLDALDLPGGGQGGQRGLYRSRGDVVCLHQGSDTGEPVPVLMGE